MWRWRCRSGDCRGAIRLPDEQSEEPCEGMSLIPIGVNVPSISRDFIRAVISFLRALTNPKISLAKVAGGAEQGEIMI